MDSATFVHLTKLGFFFFKKEDFLPHFKDSKTLTEHLKLTECCNSTEIKKNSEWQLKKTSAFVRMPDNRNNRAEFKPCCCELPRYISQAAVGNRTGWSLDQQYAEFFKSSSNFSSTLKQ